MSNSPFPEKESRPTQDSVRECSNAAFRGHRPVFFWACQLNPQSFMFLDVWATMRKYCSTIVPHVGAATRFIRVLSSNSIAAFVIERFKGNLK
jgi:hypothetical protein